MVECVICTSHNVALIMYKLHVTSHNILIVILDLDLTYVDTEEHSRTDVP